MSLKKHAVLVIAHGSPPRDFPRELLMEMRRLNAKSDKTLADNERLLELEIKVRRWPRNAQNDPYCDGTESLVDELRRVLGEGILVLAAYNEFCAPDIDEAINELVSRGAKQIEVFSTMVTPGGSHSERDIPQALEACRQRFPNIELTYRWPYDLALVAELIKAHLPSSR